MASIATWLKRGRRLFVNRCADARDIRVRFPRAVLDRLAARVAASERRHGGELLVCIEAGLPWSYIRREATARERALTLFGKLRVWDTEDNNGILIYLSLAEHTIELIADRGLNARVAAERWSAIADELGRALSDRRFEEGLNQAIDAVTALLIAHFPRDGDAPKPNALPDAPVVLA